MTEDGIAFDLRGGAAPNVGRNCDRETWSSGEGVKGGKDGRWNKDNG